MSSKAFRGEDNQIIYIVKDTVKENMFVLSVFDTSSSTCVSGMLIKSVELSLYNCGGNYKNNQLWTLSDTGLDL